MKTKIYIKIIWLLFIPVLYFIITAGNNESESISGTSKSNSDNPPSKDFINLIFTDTYFGRTNPNDPRAIENNIKNFKDSLHFNAIHVYGYDTSGGGFNSDISWYSGYVSGLMDTVKHNGLKGYYGRNKIERLCYGQRLEYEAEGGNNGFSYQTINGHITTDSGRTVVHGCLSQQNCPEADATPRYLCRNIYENLQHGDLIDFTQLDDSTWFIKPVMRIDSIAVDNNPNDSVVRIDVVNYKGRIIKSVKILAKDFSEGGGLKYPGNYINRYWTSSPLEVTGRSFDTSGIGLNFGMRSDPWNKWKDSCKVDFKVWWYGKVEVWFDKMIVDDIWGNNLFQSNITMREEFENKIIEEVNAFTDNIGSGSFFIDELTHSQIPCVKRVYEIMKQSNSNAKLHFAVTNYFNIRSYKDNSIGNRELLKELSTESFSADAHEIQDILPVTLNSAITDPLINPSWFYSNENYTLYLQKKVFGDKSIETGISSEDSIWAIDIPSTWGSLVYQIELARQQRDIYSPFKRFIMQPQIHGVLRIDSTGYYAGGVREPLNEEIEAEAMLSIAHGAEGICWFIYYGEPVTFRPNPAVIDTFKIFGLLNPESPFEHRHQNQYGQDKWKAVREMNIKMEHWKPVLDKINWTSGWSVHKDGANQNFISDIKSIYRIPSAPFTFSPSNEDATKYWEMGFFDPDFDNSTVDQYDKSKYFIMVNRRCVPDTPNYGTGDVRMLKIKFDTTDLNKFNNWRITDINTGDTMTFNVKNQGSGGFLELGGNLNSLGYFNPGEGKLFKLAPVMQEGGTLAADEIVQGVTFVCNAPVYNNGKNISILEGTKIEFKSGAGLNLNSGSLLCSNSSTNTGENVLLKGYNSQTWNGIALDNTYKSKIQRTRFEDTKTPLSIESSSGFNLYNAKIIRKNYFKITGDSGKALSVRNQHSVSIDSNTFDITSYNSTVGIYFENNLSTESEIIPAGSPQEDPEDVFAGYINISKNKFIGACYPVILSELGDNFSAYYIYNNEFVNTGLFGITARKISGIIKQNRFTDEAQNYCLYLIESFPDMLSNIFRSEKRNIVLTNSFPMLGPLRNENGQLIFKGGRNSLIITTNSEPAENIYLKYSLPIIKLGENNFSIGNTYSYHIFGSIPSEGERNYNAIRNCWEGYNGLPSIFLFQGNDTNRLGYNYIPISCIPSEETAIETQAIGFGITDTVIITAYDSSNILSDEESLFYGAIELEETGNYTEAIADFKALIDTHDSSEFIYSALDNLYSCYQAMDTSSDEEITDVLYSDLKQYLETKISSGSYDEYFEENAYSFSLMCDTRLTNYNEALAGYEFIATYNPDAEQRLMASWEYENIEEMMNGEGGGERNLEIGISDLEFEKTVERRINKLDEFVDRDPIKKHIKEEYVKSSNKNENSKTVREAIYAQKNPNEEKLIERSRQNIYGSKNLSKQQKEIKRFEDMKLLLNPENLEVNKKIENSIPAEYSLSQNYPNPFNPSTHLEFGIPNLGFVSLKVYDVLGREIKILVNEIKPAGTYKIEFDGSNFASGVYFYKLEAGEFVQTKRMVLIK